MESTLALSNARVAKEAGTIEKIESGQISVDFYNLRPVLEAEGVVYYESEQERLSSQQEVKQHG